MELHPISGDVTPVVLEGGAEVGVRPIQPDDAARLQRFHERLSRRSIYYRFFGAKPRLSERQAKHFAEVDYADRYQGQGLGRAILSLLIEAARARGIRRLYGLVLADNVRMIALLRRLGYPYHETWQDGTEQIWLELEPVQM